jgi:hypothetical protein
METFIGGQEETKAVTPLDDCSFLAVAATYTCVYVGFSAWPEVAGMLLISAPRLQSSQENSIVILDGVMQPDVASGTVFWL